MTATDYRECTTPGCTTDIPDEPGTDYCASCIREQMRAERLRRES